MCSHGFPSERVSSLVSLLIRALTGFPGGSDGKESACNVGDLGSIPGSGRSSGEGNSYPPWYSCLEKSMDREICWVQLIELDMTEQLIPSLSLSSPLGRVPTSQDDT